MEKDAQDSQDTIAASETTPFAQYPTTNYQLPTQFGFPQYLNFQQLPYQLPLAQLQPLMQTQAPIGDTGPAAAVIVASGAAAGFGWIRRKRRR
jgi:hypothetical protein